MVHTYTKKLFTVYVKLELNWLSCILSSDSTFKLIIPNTEHHVPQLKTHISDYTISDYLAICTGLLAPSPNPQGSGINS